MKLFTFLLGCPTGLHLQLSVWGLTVEQAIQNGREQLAEQLTDSGYFLLDLDWGMSGRLKIDLQQICAENLIKVGSESLSDESFYDIPQLKAA